jgi:long-subunit fatty acid transport protein
MGMGNQSVSGAIVSKTLAGTGTAHFGDEFDAVIENPAMMTYSPTEVGSHKFALDIDAFFVNLQKAPLPAGDTYAQSEGKTFFLPFFGYFYNASDKVKFGTGLYQLAGAASDFSKVSAPNNEKNSFNFIAMPFSAAYQFNETSSFGVSFNAIAASMALSNGGTDEVNKTNFTFSPSVGYVHNFSDGHMVGAHYMKGSDVTFTNMADIDRNGTLDNIKIGNPDEYSIGYGRDMGTYSYTGEYKYVGWGNAANFKDLGWKNQHVFGVAGQKKYGPYAFRTGMTFATQTVPVEKDVDGDTLVPYQGKDVKKYVVQMQNSTAGINQSAVTAGVGYEATSALTFNTGLVYYFEKEATQTGTSTDLGGAYKTSGKLQQTEVVVMASYMFNPNT